MHALLFRQWKTRVKGRDWFDLEWYIRKGFSLSLEHFSVRAIESGDLVAVTDQNLIQKLLREKIESLDFERVKEDVIRFIPDHSSLDIWSKEYFLELVKKLKII
jgi:hypothetical protein